MKHMLPGGNLYSGYQEFEWIEIDGVVVGHKPSDQELSQDRVCREYEMLPWYKRWFSKPPEGWIGVLNK